MIYSCFDPARGSYRYFEDSSTLPINADLPVPRFPAPAGKVGVPASEAGRPLPAGAKQVGTGWHARGIIVRCGGGGLSAFGLEPGTLPTWVLPVGLAVGVGALWLVLRERR